ncbi:MAG: AbrB/MazE/SpoVT family DNA-binding domain-containing protein [Candidatus Omnitrophota bacterium]
MKTVITSKYQTTIPKAIRDRLGLSVKDALEWKTENGRIVVFPVKREFLRYKNAIKIGKGNIVADIEAARNARMEKYR